MNEQAEQYKGLSGWLLLVGLGVIVSPIRLFALLATTYWPIFNDGTWSVLTTAGTASYHPLWAPLLLGEVAFNGLMFLAHLWLVVLFFTTSRLFPPVFIALVLSSLVFIPLDAWIVSFVLPDEPIFDPETVKEFGRSAATGLIWIPYLLLSKRVKATFVHGAPSRTREAQE